MNPKRERGAYGITAIQRANQAQNGNGMNVVPRTNWTLLTDGIRYIPAVTKGLYGQDMPDPELRYFNATPKPAVQFYPVAPAFHPQPPSSYLDQYMFPGTTTHPLPAQGYSYPLNDSLFTIQQKQSFEKERRRVPHSSVLPQVSTESLMTALSKAPQQQQEVTTDSLIHDEVTRVAKTLFSKRNRTLLHWLNPNVSKSQLKIDVNAAWDSLPNDEKVFYISQVLGKFAPHSTSLMVNPQLESTKSTTTRMETRESFEDKVNTSTDSGCPTDILKARQSAEDQNEKKFRERTIKREKKPQKRKREYSSSDEASCDSGLVVDLGVSEKPAEGKTIESEKPAEGKTIESEKPAEGKTIEKRKYTRRKPKEAVKKENETIKTKSKMIKTEPGTSEVDNSSNSCPMPVTPSNIKVEPGTESIMPRVKRKYVKRKLVRKKYTKKDPKKWKELTQPEMEDPPLRTTEDRYKPVEMVDPISDENSEDLDIWLNLEKGMGSEEVGCFELLSEEVDSFWESIGDPHNLFIELNLESM